MLVVRSPQASVDLVAAFEARCWARARLFGEGELELHDAVDVLQEAAVRDGLDAAIGQEKLQAMMSDAFDAVPAMAWELGAAYSDYRGVLDPSMVDELERLIEHDDPARFSKWMAWLTVAERLAVRDLLVVA